MTISTLGRDRFGLCVAVAMLAGCGALQPSQGGLQLPIAGSGAMPQTSAIATHASPPRSWMAQGLQQKDLLYVSNFYGGNVLIFTYPAGKPVGMLTSPGSPACAAKTGDWWAAGPDVMFEYAHGGERPIKTLSGASGPCAVDPTTGNLAVPSIGSGDVVVFMGGSGSGATIADGLYSSYFDAYDNKGDLFVDGFADSKTFGIVELPKGSRTFETLKLKQSVVFPGGMQWYDNYLALSDQSAHVIYHLAIHGTTAKEIGDTELNGSSDVVAFDIQKRYLVGADAGNENVALWSYPAGGSAVKFISGQWDLPDGLIVSVGKKH